MLVLLGNGLGAGELLIHVRLGIGQLTGDLLVRSGTFGRTANVCLVRD